MIRLTRQKELIPAPERGPAIRGPQDWDSLPAGFSFECGGEGETHLDIVLCDGYYYECKVSHQKASNTRPGTGASWSTYWTLGTTLAFVATKILMATYALVENLGVTAIEMKDGQGNILFEAKNGSVTCKTGNFENVDVKGVIKASAMYGETYLVTGNKTIDPVADKTSCYVFFTSGPDATLTLPDPSSYDGLEIQFILPQTMRYAGSLYVQYSGNIYYSPVHTDTNFIAIKPAMLSASTKVQIINNQLVTIKAIQGKWFVVSGFVYPS